VHALYGFTRHADEIVDRTGDLPASERARQLRDWSRRFEAGLHGERVDDPLLPAVLNTIRAFDLDIADFGCFLRSMAMDLEVHGYADYPDLLAYMNGSAGVIGTMMLPVLGTDDPVHGREPARQLGFAFQLTNFLRDVAEDLDRGRLYLPEADLALFGVHRADLERRVATPAIKDLIRYEVSRARGHYAQAAPGVALLAPGSQACIRTAFHLYRGILDEIEQADYDVFARRATVPTGKRLWVATKCLLAPAGTTIH
jgi:phytoene synthase